MSAAGKGKNRLIGILAPLMAAFIWGTSFVATSVGMENVGAFTFNSIRSLMGAAALLPVIALQRRGAERARNADNTRCSGRKAAGYGIALGLVFCVASNLQQLAFYYTTSGKIAFITALYMFFVPLLGLFVKKRLPLLTWICVFMGFVGLYFLCLTPGNGPGINKGDALAMVGAVFFAIHILMIEKFVNEVDGILLSCLQFVVTGVITCVLMFLFEQPRWGTVAAAAFPLFYTGVISGGVGNTLQIVGQKHAEATVASLLLSLESVFGVLGGAVILHEILSGREIAGCVIMFSAIVLSQLSGWITEKIQKQPGKGDQRT